ncbi:MULTISPECIES: DNA mismatch repair protein MutS [unclassified Nitrobacter]|uniref:MutS-related protein n=1 Tax=unclassified Nitrobacter TaxID=2620411 RepID=UPI000AB30343|nr:MULTISPECIES: DNA mismatch repair protein MutS [unclassified Nitrobacter]MBN9147229.1 DNA mismatch repair protein MutS [Nitrobacter sp.]
MDPRNYESTKFEVSEPPQKVVAHATLAASAEVASFGSILFPPGLERQPDHANEPDCFIDLNLDQVIAAVVAKRDEKVLRPIFYSSYRNEEIVRYRQAVFADLERSDVFALFPAFCETMRSVRASLGYAEQASCRSHQHTVFLRAVGLYFHGVTSLLHDLQSVAPQSSGLRNLLSYLTAYSDSTAFRQLASETAELQELLSHLSYGMLFRGDHVTVRKYASEPDYTVTVLERFAKFRESKATATAPRKSTDGFSLNHVEQAILEFVSRLFPAEFRRLDEFAVCHGEFIDKTIARFDHEIEFYVAYLDFIDPLKRTGLSFCYPEISVSSKTTLVKNSFDLALAAKLVPEKGAVVCNDFHLFGHERLLVVTGPNQGGKTTFARMFGQLHFLASLGCPVPGKAVRLFLPDRIFTHFEKEEDITNLRGKLEDELVRLHVSCEIMTSHSVIVLNEVFNSTSLGDQIFLSTRVLERILATDAIGVCVTFIDALSTLSGKTVSMVSTVDPENLARRTFEVIRKPADGLAYALSLAQKHGVTYEQLRRRVRP